MPGAVSLYKSGNSHNIRGIDCEMIRCEVHEIEDYLKQGYVIDLFSLNKKTTRKPRKNSKLKEKQIGLDNV